MGGCFSYLLLGDGRVSVNMAHYLKLLKISFEVWSRKSFKKNSLREMSAKHTHILLLLSDHALEKFVSENTFLKGKTMVHFSATLNIEGAFGVHPLFSFNSHLCSLNLYQSFVFVGDEKTPSLTQILPGFPNRLVRISSRNKNYYHALCVMSANFSTILWKKFFFELKEKLGLPENVVYPFLEKVTHNLINYSEDSLTGPLVRGDHETIEKDLHALKGDSFLEVFEIFLDLSKKQDSFFKGLKKGTYECKRFSEDEKVLQKD